MPLEEKQQLVSAPQRFRLHGKIFLLVLAFALLWQALLGLDTWVQKYARDMQNSFKVILTVNHALSNEQLSQIGEQLNTTEDIVSVHLFSPEDAFATVTKQNPYLVQAFLLMGKNKMPAYFEITLTPKAIANFESFMQNLAAQYTMLSPHYSEQHATFAFYANLCAKLLRIVLALTLLVFILFMFLVEAVPAARSVAYSMGGVVSGLFADVLAGLLLAALIYPIGVLAPTLAHFTSTGPQLLLLAFCGLLGWTLSKWQKF